jgi:hypothetical protein
MTCSNVFASATYCRSVPLKYTYLWHNYGWHGYY